MKANFNKDLLIKHKFWVILGLTLPVVLAGLFILLVPVADAIATQRKKIDSELAAAKKVQGTFLNTAEIEKVNKFVDVAVKKEYDVWGKVFGDQAAGFFWPAEFEKIYPFQNGKFLRELKYLEAGAPPPPDDEHHFAGKIIDVNNLFITVKNKAGKEEKFYRVDNRDMNLPVDFFRLEKDKEAAVTFQTARYFNDRLHDTEQATYAHQYHNQIRPILDMVEPVNEEGEGVVQLRDWLVPKKSTDLPHDKGVDPKFIRYVFNWNPNVDISEEAWLAQENLWIQKEFYRLIREANDYVAKMDPVADKGKGKASAFRNPYFEATFELAADNKLKVTMRNLRNQRQKLEVNFRVRFNQDATLPWEKIHIEGEPLDPPGTLDKKGNPTDVFVKEIDLAAGPQRTGIYEVHQRLTWETAAVRRIDQITIGSMAPEETAVNHRIFPEGTRPLVMPKIDELAVPVEGGPGGGGEGRGPGPGPGGIGFGGQNVDLGLTLNHLLIKNRYVEVNDQARRIPVAVALIVDQDHIDRVMTAFSNSKFRFLLSQVMINRYPVSLRPNLPAKDEKGNDPNMFRGFAPPPFAGGGEGRGPGPGAARFVDGGGPGAGAMSGQVGQTGDEEMEANVELVLYGTVTLYERFPPRRIPATGAGAADEKKLFP